MRCWSVKCWCWGCGRCRHKERHQRATLRAKLTLSIIAMLTLGIAAALWVSTMGIRHYMVANIDSDLRASRNGLQRTGLTSDQVAALAAIADLSGKFAAENHSSRTLFTVVGRDGEAAPFGGVPLSPAQRALADAVPDAAALALSGEPVDATAHGTSYRVTALRLGGSDGRLLLLANSTTAVTQTMHKVVRMVLTVGVVLVACLGAATFIGARRRLRPLEDMVETASAIAEGCPQGLDLSRRVASRGRAHSGGEVEQLRTALNAMLQQLETAFHTREHAAGQLRRFVEDASHELRTPLAAIRGYLQLEEKGMFKDEAERARAMGRMNAEAERMARLVDELLALARLDQRPRLRPAPVDLACVARGAAADLSAQQPGRPVELGLPADCLVLADEPTLHQIVSNLLANVRIHTPADARVRVTVAEEDGHGVLRVADEGPGMRPQDAERVFDRFFRTGGAEGSGLGMAVVRAAVDAHGGTVRVTTAPGAGLTVAVALPSARPAAAAGPGPVTFAGPGPVTSAQARVEASSTTVTSGGAPTRTGGPQAPAPRVT
ncbi:HAMP domain-containing sensor histidine kinase [Streptomyces sp. NPDC097640]|uniref:sensor histidine kinase n=1 Tax=Streptomyces sp. NPDC097640 TaxID=3157229 RepID=UPI0033196EEB